VMRSHFWTGCSAVSFLHPDGTQAMTFKLTYATMFNPPDAMHERFEAALAVLRSRLGSTHDLYLDGADVATAARATRASPIDSELTLGHFALADHGHVDRAMQAARRAAPAWRALPAAERAGLVRRVGDVMEERVYDIAAALAIEVGKNRMEALGEAQETVDFFRHYADDFQSHDGYEHVLPDDPLPGAASHNRSVMRPYGTWAVIAPFNFPLALAGGPAAAALVTGNTVVLKGASDTPWAGRLLADCVRDAGLPAGVFNYLSGSGREVGEALVEHAETAGVTFTGSAAVGMHIAGRMAAGRYPRPCIAEMGGKNPCIVTAGADLEHATQGIVRSAYGMGGQKCSATSRLYVEESVADELLDRLAEAVASIRIGDPLLRENWLGPVVNASAYGNYVRYVDELRAGGARVLRGGRQLREGAFARGYYVEPVLAEAPRAHPLWKHEMFLPILMVERVPDREIAMALANDTDLGLTAGFYGAQDEVAWFQDHIEAGVTYANRPQGATTGAWPGYQPFGGWKGSGSTGKAIASFYYLAQYMREQSRTVVE
jgi:acyl-CoA reductase-like NAD-dependent aldehyde dehydrogenase